MLYEKLASNAVKYAAHPAIETDADSISYQELVRAVDDFSLQLLKQGFGAKDPLIMLFSNSAEFVIAFYAIAKIGAIAIPLNINFQENELIFYLKDSQAKGLITSPDLTNRYANIISETEVQCLLLTYHFAKVEEDLPLTDRLPDYTGDVLFQYSSGSTGIPKRVTRTQANLMCEAQCYNTTVSVSENDRILAVVPLYHAHGFGNCMLAATYSGATLIILPVFKRKKVLNTLISKKITIFPGVPFMYGILAESPSVTGGELQQLRLAFSAGAPLDRGTFDKFYQKFGISVRQLYGSTETGAVTINLDEPIDELSGSIGKPLQGIEVALLNDNNEPVAAGEEGELVVSSKAMTSGYANLDEESNACFQSGRFWTGDIGRMDSRDNLYITGRKKLFINAAGNKVDPAQVEAVINEHPAVSECVVIGVQGQYGQEIVKAVVVSSTECSVDEIKNWCLAKLAAYKVPQVVEFREEIPKSPLGKILRKYLQDDMA